MRINKFVIKNKNSWKKDFIKNKPFSNVIIKNFLEKEDAVLLRDEVLKEDYSLKFSDLFCFYQTNDLNYSNKKRIKEFLSLVNSKEVHYFLEGVTSKKIKKHADTFSSIYTKTNYLLCHDDLIEKRKIAYILYLGDNFTKKDGGALVLRDNLKGMPSKITKEIYPKFNSLVIFEVSNKSFHEVEEVISNKTRLAIGGWFY